MTKTAKRYGERTAKGESYPFRDLVELPKTRCSNDVSARSLNPKSIGTPRRTRVMTPVQAVGDVVQAFKPSAKV